MSRVPPDPVAKSDALEASAQVVPFLRETLTTKALQFSIGEIQSRMDLRDPYALDLDYTRTMMAFLLFRPRPRHIAMIGLGGGSLAKFCHRHLPQAQVQVVEINPHVIALRDHFHVPPDGERFQVVRGDGAQFVRQCPVKPDVLLVDGFDSSGQPEALCSQRFYDDCSELLHPGGLMVVNLHRGHRHHARHVDRIGRSFGGDLLVVDDDELTNSVVFACEGEVFGAARAGGMRRPRSLARDTSAVLRDAFARVNRARLRLDAA